MAYNRGVKILENPTSLAAPVLGTAALQVVVGVSPVNLAEDPYNATNIPKLAHSLAEASAAVGYSGNFKDYNLNQSINATFAKFAVAPVILINVLDPKRHKTTVSETACGVDNMQAVLQSEGVLLDTVIVKDGENTLQEGTDYIASFDGAGFVVVTLLEAGSAAEAARGRRSTEAGGGRVSNRTDRHHDATHAQNHTELPGSWLFCYRRPL